MKNAKVIFAACIALAAGLVFGGIDCLYLTDANPSVEISVPAKVLSLDVGGASVKFERITSGTEERVTEHALTNFTYSVVTTNATTGAATTNVLSRPHPIPYPDTMIGYWTNEIVRTWAVTNVVPIVTSAVTNDVETNTYLAPGDAVFSADISGKGIIFIER